MPSLTEYLKNKSLEDITEESVRSAFKITEKNTNLDLYASHLLLTKKRDNEDIIYKMLEIFFANGLNPNLKGFAEYNFLHIALYGGDNEKGETLPYPLSLFEKIIPLAKKYGLNVNCKDEDGDTLIHTAIYSEGYFDKIEPLIRLLGPNFNITAKNKKGETIIDALNESIKEAKSTKNDAWYKQLKEEKDLLISIMKASSNPMFHIPEYTKEPISVSNYLDPECYKKDILEKINALMPTFEAKEKEKLTMELTSKKCKAFKESVTNSGLTDEEKEEFLSKIKHHEAEIQEALKSEIERIIQSLSIDSQLEECEKIDVSIDHSYLPQEMIEPLKSEIAVLMEAIKQQLLIAELKKQIQNIKTIQDIHDCINHADAISDPEFKQEIESDLKSRLEKAEKEMEEIKDLFHAAKVLLESAITYFHFEPSTDEEGILKDIKISSISDEEIEGIEVQYFDTYRQTLNEFSKEITLTLEEKLKEAIQKELEKAKVVDQAANTNLVSVVLTEFERILGEATQENQKAPQKQKKQ